jgi:hypothetical protein
MENITFCLLYMKYIADGNNFNIVEEEEDTQSYSLIVLMKTFLKFDFMSRIKNQIKTKMSSYYPFYFVFFFA